MSSTVYDEILKSLKVAGMLPLDPKGYFQTISQLETALGIQSVEAFKFYEGMPAYCVENQTEYRWEEVAQNYTQGALPQNFQYPNGTISNNIDYSLRYFNFVPKESTPISASIGDPYVIFKGYQLVSGNYIKNNAGFLEIGDIVIGHFSETVFMTAKYLGGSLNSPSSWAYINGYNPTLINTPGIL